MPRDKRQARNREMYRFVNVRIAEVTSSFSVASESQRFVCECAHTGCTEQVDVPLAVYERVLNTRSAFLVCSGHEDPTTETIACDGNGYLIVLAEPQLTVTSVQGRSAALSISRRGSLRDSRS